MELPEEQRFALAMELSGNVSPHPGIGERDPGYEEWFRAGVEEALADTTAGISHSEVVSDLANILRSAREAKGLKASA
jgi:hypothetical protein